MSESNLIQMPGHAPNLITNREREQWLNAKPTRKETLDELTSMANEIHIEAAKQSNRISNLEANLGKVATMTRMASLQLETLIIIFEKAIPEFRKNYTEHLGKTLAMVSFLDTINTPNTDEPKSMREKIQLAREYNALEDSAKILLNYFLLDKYIEENPNEFSEEEVEALAKEFSMDITVTKEPVPVGE